MASSADSFLDRARGRALESTLLQGVTATVLAFFSGVITGVIEASQLFTNPLDEAGEALADLVAAVFGGPPRIVLAGIQETINSLLGPFSAGPFTAWFALAIALGMIYMVAWYLRQEETGNVLPGLPDLPGPIGREEEDE